MVQTSHQSGRLDDEARMISVSLKEAYQLAQDTNSTLADAAELLLASADLSGEPESPSAKDSLSVPELLLADGRNLRGRRSRGRGIELAEAEEHAAVAQSQ